MTWFWILLIFSGGGGVETMYLKSFDTGGECKEWGETHIAPVMLPEVVKLSFATMCVGQDDLERYLRNVPIPQSGKVWKGGATS